MSRRRRPPRIGLALAGGGPLGAIYEIGALCAIDEVFAGLDLNALDAYVGVSAGGFIAAALANGMTPREICAAFIENSGDERDIFRPSVLLQPAWGEIAGRLWRLPALALRGAGEVWRRPSWGALLEQLGSALPTGVFSNDALAEQLRRQFERPGRSNDFRTLRRKLVLVATDLDSGESAPFGLPGLDHVPISKAVQASAALPGLFPPVEIDGRHYVDGVLKKTLHASVLLDQGIDLMLCLNPLVPFDATPGGDVARPGGRIPRLVDGGLPVVLSQTFRTLIHSRLELGMRGYGHSHPDTTIVLFEPDHRDPRMFLANTFGYAERRALAEHAYQQTRLMLRQRRASLAPKLAAHGVTLRGDRLDDPSRTLIPAADPAAPPSRGLGDAIDRLDGVLDTLDAQLARRQQVRG